MINPVLIFINKTLETNEGSRLLLLQYKNKSFKINFNLLSIAGMIGNHGYIEPVQNDTIDVEITIPFSTATYLINQDKLEIFKKIIFTGDINFGRNILEIFSNLKFSGAYADASPLYLFLFNNLIKIFGIISTQVKLISNNASHSISEYLQYESEDLVTKYEMENFCNSVDDLNNRTNRLVAQIHLLTELPL